MENEVQKFWDANPCGGEWDSIDKLIEWRNITEPHIWNTLKKFNVKGKILDVGCGQGIELTQNLRNGNDVIGLDFSKESLKRIKGSIVCGDAENLPFKSLAFSLVYSFGVLHHIQRTEKGIREIQRVLKYGGIAIIILYNKMSWKGFVVSITRFISRMLRINITIYNALKEKVEENNPIGTALLELFGCPVLKMYTKGEVMRMFRNFSSVKVECYSSNLFQLSFFLPFGMFAGVLKKIDKKIEHILGFHLVIICRKPFSRSRGEVSKSPS